MNNDFGSGQHNGPDYEQDYGQEYGKCFALWRGQAAEVWRQYTRHAFVEGLCDGSLPRENFLHYLKQDYVYLIHYSRAWALAVVKADSLAEMKYAAATVNALINEEIQLHVTLCAAEGIPEQELFKVTEEPENLAYTRYVLDAGLAGDFLDMMAALAPCVFGYGEIGARLSKEASSDTPYRQWIDTYAGEDYQSLCRDVGAMIDQAVSDRLGADWQASPRWQKLQARFDTATRLEVGFWQMGMRGAS